MMKLNTFMAPFLRRITWARHNTWPPALNQREVYDTDEHENSTITFQFQSGVKLHVVQIAYRAANQWEVTLTSRPDE